ncbi:hypothetical protein BKN38_07710 [Helicobacter sp. CLO-3]|nr:hypothetical protein BA723_09605 [Helicobacter sp. CLO-3]OHU82030.1 hypothetical protein BKN38_07710 [Helicobacter sp. CLO-3]
MDFQAAFNQQSIRKKFVNFLRKSNKRRTSAKPRFWRIYKICQNSKFAKQIFNHIKSPCTSAYPRF